METDIKVTKPKRKVAAKVVSDVVVKTPPPEVIDVAPKITPSVAPSVETGASVVVTEPHHGKLIAITIVSVVAVIAILVSVFSLGGGANTKKGTSSVTGNVPSAATTTPAPIVVPTESFMIADTPAKPPVTESTSSGAAKTSSPTSSSGAKVLPPSENFKSFVYDAATGKNISVSGTCHDAYYALLIFDSKDDYRTNPSAARANRAYECTGTGLFTIKMDLRDINLPSGEYYLFIADQGKTGSWYNPR